jgi:parallel beta-helix repeat protein
MPLKNDWANGDLFTPAAANDMANAVNSSNSNGGTTLNFIDYGVCDGTTNDRAAFATALAALATAGGGTLLLPPKDIAITMNAQPTFDIPANTRIVGTRGATRLLLSSTANDAYVAFAGSAGNNVTFEGITFLRNTNCTGFVFYPNGYDGFHVNNCVLNGQTDIYDKTFHGWILHRVNLVTPKRNITIRDSIVTKFSYGLLQADTAAGDIDTIVVDNCHFSYNHGDDLEFNAPLGEMTNVLVSNCRFTNMQSTTVAAGLGVGFCGVDGAVVRDCFFDGTYSDAIHLEHGAVNILLANNRFVGCANNTGTNVTELDRASINIMGQCNDVIVSGNTIDHRPNANTNGLHAIAVRNYSGGVSVGGFTALPPRRITITDNIILCGENFGGIWACDIADLTITGNRIIADGLVTSGAWDDGNIRAGIMADGINTVITDNAVSGFRYGITGPLAEDSNGAGGLSLAFADRKALGDPGTVVGNTVSDCYIGLVLVPSGRVNTSGNSMSNCVRPMVVGERENTAKPCTVTNNFAIGCTYPLEIGGKHIVVRSVGGSTVTVGSSKTVNVNDTLLKLPVGTQITFSGGGVLTLTTAVTASALYTPGTPKALVGTVSMASITAGEYGTVTGLAHSTTAANNKVMTFNNADTQANVYDSDEARRKGTTKKGTNGSEDGVLTWSKIASLNISSTFYSGAAVTLAVTSGVGAFETAILGLHAYSQETGQPNLVTLEMIAKSGTTAYILPESFKAVSGNYGTTVDLWMLKNAAGGIFNVYELTRHLSAGGTVTYFTDSPWQSATPTGTVSVTTQGVTAFGVPVVTTTATQTITGKTLTSPTLTTPVLGTPSSGNLTNCTFPTLNQNTTGSAASLTTGRTVQADLGSTSSATFNGTANITPGVTGTLPVGNGGTGATTLTGLVKGTGTTAMVAATAGTDYVAPGGALGTPSSGTLTNCTFPTLNQNTTGTASNVTGTVAVANGGTGSTNAGAARGALGAAADVQLTTGEAIFARDRVVSNTLATNNSIIRLMFFTATKTETITQVRTRTGSTAGVGMTTCQIGVYSADADDALTLIASTPNDTALWTSASTDYTKSFSASFSKVAGNRYAVAILVAGSSTAPTMAGFGIAGTDQALAPRICVYASSGTLASTISTGSMVLSASMIYAALLP